MDLKLGKKEYKSSEKDFKYSKYVNLVKLPTYPNVFGHNAMFKDWGMLGNDIVGDCVFAGADHETMIWTTEGKKPASFTNACALSDYSKVTGYVSGDPSTDNGTDVREALTYRRKTGIKDSKGKRHKIGAFLLLDQKNLNHILTATYLFSAVGIGLRFPDSAMEQFDQNKPWTVVKGPEPKEGHYVPIVGYDGKYIYCVTWGKTQAMSIDFFLKYCDEAWAILSEEFLVNGKSPEGFDLNQLKQDLSLLK